MIVVPVSAVMAYATMRTNQLFVVTVQLVHMVVILVIVQITQMGHHVVVLMVRPDVARTVAVLIKMVMSAVKIVMVAGILHHASLVHQVELALVVTAARVPVRTVAVLTATVTSAA